MDIYKIFEKDEFLKNDIGPEVFSRINSCLETIKEAIPSLFKLHEGMDMREEIFESLTNTYPQ